MRILLTILGALVLVPFVIGFVFGIVLFGAVPYRMAKAALIKRARARHPGFYEFAMPPVPKTPARPERMN